MKLQRFTAADNHRVILKVHEKLGPDALVYSTRRIPNGVEVLAGLSGDSHNSNDYVQIEKQGIDQESLDKLNIQLQMMEETIQKLSTHITMLYQVVSDNLQKKKWLKKTITKWINWNVFKHLGRIRKKRGSIWKINNPLV